MLPEENQGAWACYRTFARMFCDFEAGRLAWMKTAGVAALYQIDRRTASRWQANMQDVFTLTVDQRGYWRQG